MYDMTYDKIGETHRNNLLQHNTISKVNLQHFVSPIRKSVPQVQPWNTLPSTLPPTTANPFADSHLQ